MTFVSDISPWMIIKRIVTFLRGLNEVNGLRTELWYSCGDYTVECNPNKTSTARRSACQPFQLRPLGSLGAGYFWHSILRAPQVSQHKELQKQSDRPDKDESLTQLVM